MVRTPPPEKHAPAYPLPPKEKSGKEGQKPSATSFRLWAGVGAFRDNACSRSSCIGGTLAIGPGEVGVCEVGIVHVRSLEVGTLEVISLQIGSG